MFNPKLALLYFFVIAVLLEPILGRGGHTYPKSGGFSGIGRPSGRLSGGGSGSNRHPPNGNLSGRTGTHTHPLARGSHGNPTSGAKPGKPSSGGSQKRKSSSGSLSGNSHEYSRNKPAVIHSTNNYHYHYSPPQQIAYSPHHGAAPVSYPVYHGTPPTYVYQYKDSGSKYGTLLAGLALLNLGTHAASGSHSGGGSRTQYTPQPGEVCKFEVRRDNGDYEQTKIDCKIISSFILQDQVQSHTSGTNTTTTVVTVTNTTVMNATNMMSGSPPTASPVPAVDDDLYKMLRFILQDQAQSHASGTNIATTEVTVTNTTVMNATNMKPGSPPTASPVPAVNGDLYKMLTFILQDQAQSHASGTNIATTEVTVTNTTFMNATNMKPGSPPTASPVPAVGDVLYKMLANGTLVPVNVTVPGVSVVPGSPANVTQNVTGAVPQNGIMTSSVVTTTTTNTTLVNALDVKGKPVKVTPRMKCFVIRNSRKHNMRKQVPCGLLQTYADKSILTT